ncbi:MULTISPECIES: hypothetical protein [Caulobacter]|jgi:hypothetical protein|uniref:Uncharacterized protein n=1 Tax=Caulobacter vibrioides OR37 TaxID=1292034 RepID=R0CWV1_CAUVI|nr:MULTISPECIES: hypothetical protein [Caulobacter]ENZ80991.1 hypothetical protein OR37_03119 [Caulobacter vibrioides OR37]MBQ1559374.1 hypothetical protein [Caulobacter sp.]
MATKAFFAAALILAAAIGLVLPTPGASHATHPAKSSFETIALNKG